MQEKLNPWKWKTEFGVARVPSKAEHYESLRKLLARPMLLLDTETTGLSHDRELRLVQIGWKNKAFVLCPARHEQYIQALMDNRQQKLIAHNAPFDLLSLGFWRYGNSERAYSFAVEKALRGQVIDTAVTEQWSASEPKLRSLSSLAALEGVHNFHEEEWDNEAERLGLTKDSKYAAVSVNNEHYLRYSAHDIWQLRVVYERNKKLHNSYHVQIEVVCAVLYDVLKARGMELNYELADNLFKELDRDKEAALEVLDGYGIANVNSTAQVAEALARTGAKLVAKTATGRPQVNKAVLQKIEKPKKAAKLALKVIEARSLGKDMASIANLVQNSENGRVHPSLWRIGAITGRSSCSNPNLQQLNKHTGDARVRGLLQAEEGHCICSVDFDNIEIRTIADLSGDKRLIQRMRDGADVHSELAQEVGVPRQKAKIGNFAMLYGASASSIASQTDMDIEQARGLQEAWEDLYPTMAQAMADWRDEASETGSIRLPNGWTPEVGWFNGERAAYRAVNYMVQGWAAFIFRRAAVQVALAGLWPLVRMVVHDEFACAVEHEYAEEQMQSVMKAATVHTARMEYTTGGELYGRNWGLK